MTERGIRIYVRAFPKSLWFRFKMAAMREELTVPALLERVIKEWLKNGKH